MKIRLGNDWIFKTQFYNSFLNKILEKILNRLKSMVSYLKQTNLRINMFMGVYKDFDIVSEKNTVKQEIQRILQFSHKELINLHRILH